MSNIQGRKETHQLKYKYRERVGTPQHQITETSSWMLQKTYIDPKRFTYTQRRPLARWRAPLNVTDPLKEDIIEEL